MSYNLAFRQLRLVALVLAACSAPTGGPLDATQTGPTGSTGVDPGQSPDTPGVTQLSIEGRSVVTAEDTPLSVSLTDLDDLALTITTAPQHGTLSVIVGQSATYTPAPDFFGIDSFVFTAARGAASGSATVTITVTPVEDAPVLSDDDLVVDEAGQSSTLVGGATSVLANDVDVDGPALSASLVEAPKHGVLSFNADGTFTYDHDGVDSEPDAFTYAVGELVATVHVLVSPTPQPALANLQFNGSVYAAKHVGHAWYLGGDFTLADMKPARNLIAVDSNGQPVGCDVGAGFNDYAHVRAILVLGDAVYAAGSFTEYQGLVANNIAKIDATTCALDTTFNPQTGGNGFDENVRTIVASGGALFVGGDFMGYRGAGARRIAKLDPIDGTLDLSFNPQLAPNGFDDAVSAITVDQSALYVVGNFTSYRGETQRFVTALNQDGTLFTTAGGPLFGPTGGTNGFDAPAYDISLGSSAAFIVGAFSKYKNENARRIAKVSLGNGALDTTFGPTGPTAVATGFDNVAYSVVVSPARQSVFVAGAFNHYRDASQSSNNAKRLVELDATNGSIIPTFGSAGASSNGFTGDLRKLVLMGDALIVSGVPLGAYRGGAENRTGVAKIFLSSGPSGATGQLDTSFMKLPGHDVAGFSQPVHPGGYFSAAYVAGSTLWLGGPFTHIGGKNVGRIARIKDSDGRLDDAFNAATQGGFNGSVFTITGDKRALYVGGAFDAFGPEASSARRLVKLDPLSAAIDTAFGPTGPTAGFDGAVYTLALERTSLYVGGSFDSYRGGASNAQRIAKLDPATGALDATFQGGGGFDESVLTLALDDTSVYVGGEFTAHRGGVENALSIAKLNKQSGELDTTFSPPAANGFDGSVNTLVRHGTALFAGGSFDSYRGGSSLGRIAKLDATSGALDESFTGAQSVKGFDDDVHSLLVYNQALYVGGLFFNYRDASANNAVALAKLNPVSGELDTSFSPSGVPTREPSIYTLSRHHDLLLLGGEFNLCDDERCHLNAMRVSASDRSTR